jgi:2-keto-3-deoxy-L-rhamnonate aldolase RhmA
MISPTFRDAFRRGDSLVGFQLTSVGPHWAKHLRGMLQFVFIDCEHHCFSREQVAWICGSYAAAQITPLVRVLRPDASLVRAAFDDGAHGVVVPYVETVDQVRSVAAAAKLRPIQGARAAAVLAGQPLDTKTQADSEKHCGGVSLILQIESRIAVDAIEDLIAVPGVDGVLVGPYDLTATLGCLADHSHADFQTAAKRVAQVARSAGLGAGIYFAESPPKEAMAKSWGYNLIIAGCDWTLIKEAMRLR